MSYLYHCTTKDGLEKILRSNMLKASPEESVCLTRDRRHVPGSAYCTFRITLDRDKLAANYKIIPYGKPADEWYAGRSEASESEERVYKNITDVARYIVDIQPIEHDNSPSDEIGYLSDFDG